MAARPVILGIDLGTTSVKAALVEAVPGDPSGFVVLASCARAARAEAAAQSAAAGPQGQEQDVSRIIQALNECLAALPRQLLQDVCGIGVSGQMHGVMFWKTGQEQVIKTEAAVPFYDLGSKPDRPNFCFPWTPVLNISTSVQLATSMPSGFQPAQTPDPAAPVTYFPYFDRIYLAVAASLNGGNVLATFVHMLVQWMADLGLEVEESTVYSCMIQAAAQQRDTCLTITPTVLGERHLPDQLASVTRISSSDLSLGHVTRALCRGIVQNLHSMLPFQQLKEWGVERVIGSGSALSRNDVLKQEVQRAFPFPVSFGQDVDAAVGAAVVMLQRNLNQRES
ncbi:sedoheptulokinase [Leptonychotes weddellii]|uniref:Sedoheptulokinase n=1 Tax=Leptonychotes weddellii TaxID=9713 RepID=A0A7F8PXE6_LEPWE|nr:sedoheptulokinase [Leptonychotes weddellii]